MDNRAILFRVQIVEDFLQLQVFIGWHPISSGKKLVLRVVRPGLTFKVRATLRFIVLITPFTGARNRPGIVTAVTRPPTHAARSTIPTRQSRRTIRVVRHAPTEAVAVPLMRVPLPVCEGPDQTHNGPAFNGRASEDSPTGQQITPPGPVYCSDWLSGSPATVHNQPPR